MFLAVARLQISDRQHLSSDLFVTIRKSWVGCLLLIARLMIMRWISLCIFINLKTRERPDTPPLKRKIFHIAASAEYLDRT